MSEAPEEGSPYFGRSSFGGFDHGLRKTEVSKMKSRSHPACSKGGLSDGVIFCSTGGKEKSLHRREKTISKVRGGSPV